MNICKQVSWDHRQHCTHSRRSFARSRAEYRTLSFLRRPDLNCQVACRKFECGAAPTTRNTAILQIHDNPTISAGPGAAKAKLGEAMSACL